MRERLGSMCGHAYTHTDTDTQTHTDTHRHTYTHTHKPHKYTYAHEGREGEGGRERAILEREEGAAGTERDDSLIERGRKRERRER